MQKVESVTGVLGANYMSFLTDEQSRAIVAGNAGERPQFRHGDVLHNNKHRHNYIQATIGRAGSVNKISNHKFLTHSPKAGGFCFWAAGG
jgi:hypothetical protein